MERTPAEAALAALHRDHSRDGQMCWCDYERVFVEKGKVVRKPGHTRECLNARKVMRPHWRRAIEEVRPRSRR